jgi:hypothetical protein
MNVVGICTQLQQDPAISMQQPDYTQVLVSICATSNMHQQNACHFNMVVTLSDLSTGMVTCQQVMLSC